MALINCKDCKKQFSTDAKRCPHCGAKKPSKKIFLKIIGLLLLILVIGQSKGQRIIENAQQEKTKSVLLPVYPDDPIKKAEVLLQLQTIEGVAIAGGIADLRGIKKEEDDGRFKEAQDLIKKLEAKRDDYATKVNNLSYETSDSLKSVDNHWNVYPISSPMDDSSGMILKLEADNQIDTWLKKYRPTLYVRCQESQTNLYIDTGTAAQPELGKYNQATIRLRLDEKAPSEQLWNESTDSKALFAPNAISLTKQIANSKRMIFEFVPFNSPPAVIYFNVTGLNQYVNKFADLCKWNRKAHKAIGVPVSKNNTPKSDFENVLKKLRQDVSQ